MIRGRYRARGKSTGSPIIMPLMGVAVQNRVNQNQAGSTGRTRQVFRWKYTLGSDVTSLAILLHGWRQGTTSQVNNTNAFTVLEYSITANGVTVADDPNTTISVSEEDGVFDEIPASSFGLATLTRGRTIWVKGIASVASGGNTIPQTIALVGDETGQQGSWYDPGATSVTATDVDGVYVLTGGTPAAATSPLRPMLLGRPTSNTASFIAIGDSIGESVNDNGANFNGRGFIQKGMRDSGSTTFRPCINLSRNGATAAGFSSQSKHHALFKYANLAIDELGTNTLGTSPAGSNLTTLQADCATNWGAFNSGGIDTIIRTKLLPRTSVSTDSYQTEANQTINAGWGDTGFSEQFNDWLETQLSGNAIQYLIDCDSVRGVDPFKWRVDGTSNYVNVDGTHPNAVGHEFLAEELRLVTLTV